MKPGPDLADNGTRSMTAMGIIAALYQRQRTSPAASASRSL